MMLFFAKMIARNGPPRCGGRGHFFVRNNYSTMTAKPATTSSSLFNTTSARSSLTLSLQNLAVAHNYYSLATCSNQFNAMVEGGGDKRAIAAAVTTNYHYHYQQCNTFSTTTRRRRSRIIHNRTTENDNPANEDDSSSSSANNHHGGDDGGGMTKASTGILLSTEQFLIVANEFLDKVEVAVTKLKDCNEGIEIIRYPRGTISDDTTAATADSNVEDDDDENPTSTIIRHDGRLSIQIMSTGDLFYGGGTYWLTIHADYYDDGDARYGGNDSSSDVPPGSSTTNGNNYGGNNYITLQSPLSGSYMYIYNVITKEWVGSEDGHSLYGMFTRDWIRQCNGVPDL